MVSSRFKSGHLSTIDPLTTTLLPLLELVSFSCLLKDILVAVVAPAPAASFW